MSSQNSRGRGGRGGKQGGGRGDKTPSGPSRKPQPSSSTFSSLEAQPKPPAVEKKNQEAKIPFELDEAIVPLSKVRPAKKLPGVKGKKVQLYANSYQLSIPDNNCYQYDVDIKPETKGPISRIIIQKWQDINASQEAKIAVYDGKKILYTPRRIPNAPFLSQEIIITDNASAREQKFLVSIREVAVVNMEALHKYIEGKGDSEITRPSLHVLDILLSTRPNALFVSVNRSTGSSFFKAYDPSFNISNGLNLSQGWKQSVRVTYKEVLLNLDVAATAFYQQGNLLQVVAAFFNKNRIQDIDFKRLAPGNLEFQRLSKFLSNVNIKIEFRDTGRTRYKILRLNKNNANQQKTTGDTIVPISEFFKKTYQITLQYPQLPLLVCGNGDVNLPMELCYIRTAQRHLGKLSDVQTADVIKITAIPPPDRSSRIQTGRKELHSVNSDQDSLLKAWNVSIKPNMKMIDARILQTPTVSGSADVTPSNGAYDLSKQGKVKFFRPAKLHIWGVAVFGDPRSMPFEAMTGFMIQLFKECENRGMTVAKRNFGDVMVAQGRRTVQETLLEANRLALDSAMKEAPAGFVRPESAQMIFCVWDRNSPYEEVKLFAETKYSIMTQCFLAKHLPPRGPKPGVCVNLALKINAKLGGINMMVDPVKQLNVLGKPIPTMIMGADVTHPPAGANGGVSIAAIVGSMDGKYAEYRSSIRVQGPRIEIIDDIAGMCKELFQQFAARCGGRFPQRLIFFRDGVSESQFGEVALQEVQKLKLFIRELGIDCKITFLVVNKRHHHRFFCVNPKDGDRKGNVMAGTVVDTGVTHPFEFDFFLNSHQGLQGTSRSSHYHVLFDENDFTPDDLQEITYRMCYLFARASRSVSIVPAVYYAHLVAYRARCYRVGSSDMESITSGGIDNATMDQFQPVTEVMKKMMFFT